MSGQSQAFQEITNWVVAHGQRGTAPNGLLSALIGNAISLARALGISRAGFIDAAQASWDQVERDAAARKGDAWSSPDAGVTATDILQWLTAAREQAPHCRPDSPEAEDQRRIALLCNALMWARAPQGEPGERAPSASPVQPSVDYLRVTDPILQTLSRQNEAQARLIAELQETAHRITRCWHCHDALIPPEPKHCERCPSFGDCHVRNCPEPGCDVKEPWSDDD